MQELSSRQRRYLQQLAVKLDPAVIVGKQGVTDMLVRAVSESLDAHELVKVRFNEFKDEKQALTEQIAFRTGSTLCGMVGHTAALYRQHPEEDKRKITLPEQ